MAFYSQDPQLEEQLSTALAEITQLAPEELSNISATWVVYNNSPIDIASSLNNEDFWQLPIKGASYQGQQLRYPASVVKLFYGAAIESWLGRDLLLEGPELRRAFRAMLQDSSNDATSFVVDLLTGTNSGAELPEDPLNSWARQRLLVNQWFAKLGWAEWEGCNACQKTWTDGPYGREQQFYGPNKENRNRLNTDITARLLHAVIAGAWQSPLAGARLRGAIARSLDIADRKADLENQVDGFLGAGIPEGSFLWSKAGWMSTARHDAAYCEVPDCPPFLLVVFSEGSQWAADEQFLPYLAAKLWKVLR
ncbi:MAG: serine hydrolase [Synechococcus sp. LacPavin_0920_WC12_MAG_50_7]|nr:serine hydrolase [Synechococcus sp. LacPavin_0920_WC12_MAG_50_7]